MLFVTIFRETNVGLQTFDGHTKPSPEIFRQKIEKMNKNDVSDNESSDGEEEIVKETVEEVKEDLSNSDVTTKYKLAAEIVNVALVVKDRLKCTQ